MENNSASNCEREIRQQHISVSLTGNNELFFFGGNNR